MSFAIRHLPLALCALLVAVPVNAESLLSNGDFETTNANGDWPRGWGRASHVSYESEEGNRFLRLASPSPGTYVAHYTEVPLPRDIRALELTFRRRVSNLVVGESPWYDARIILNFKDADGKKRPAPRLPYANRDTSDWEPVTFRFLIPEGTVSLEFMPSLFRTDSGIFDIDDVVLRPIDPAEIK